MRIAVVHSYYSSRQPSGENIAVDSQVALLREAGHDVVLVTQRTDDRERGHSYPLEAAWTVATGHGRSPLAALRRFRPDVVHVHNLFPNWGTRWLFKWDGPLVATLHNFRPLCAAGTLYRQGQTCTLCPDGDRWAGVRYGCYRGSRVASLPVVWRNRNGATGDAVLARADRLIVPSTRARDVYVGYGVPRARISEVPNFIRDPFPDGTPTTQANGRWLFVGRLTPEKGLAELLPHWPENVGLDVVGDGPLLDEWQAAAPSSIRFLGVRQRDQILRSMPAYIGLVFPSRCFEGLPTVMLEAFAAGLPLACREGTSAADVIRESDAGVVVTDDADWASGVERVATNRAWHSAQARASYASNYSPDRWISTIEDTYRAVHKAKTGRCPSAS